MGYRGKLEERARARQLRTQGWTMPDIAEHLGVSRSSVSLWTRDVPVDPALRRSPRTGRRPRGSDHPLRRRKEAEIAALDRRGRDLVGQLSHRELLLTGAALYAGEGAKGGNCVSMANTDPALLQFFTVWLRTCFEVDESRLRAKVYLHDGLDLEAAEDHWSTVVDIPRSQFTAAYRAADDRSRRGTKHRFGCATVSYSCTRTHRQIMGVIRALPGAVPRP